MASVESSIASVPMSKLMALEEQLRNKSYQAASAVQPEAATSKFELVSTNPPNHDQDTATAPSTIVESVDAYNAPQVLSQDATFPPRLSSSKSAPEHEMDAMVQESESLVAFSTWTKALSFTGGFPGGDTQPMDTQIYRESISRPANTTPQKPVMRFPFSPAGRDGTYNTTATDRTPKTCAAGDTGFIDLAAAYQPPSPTAHSISDTDEAAPSPNTQFLLTSATKSAPPETPVLAGQKHGRDGELITSAPTTEERTPGFSQLFRGASRAQVLSATQMFDQTQTPSSPIPDAPRSDPVITRPSPNLTAHLSHSSPAAVASSPLMTKHSRPGTAGGEPRAYYRTVDESQECREQAEARQRMLNGITEDAHEDDDDEDSAQRRYNHRRLHKIMSDQALEDLPRFSAPSRPGSRPLSSRKQHLDSINLITPATIRKGIRLDFDGSDDDMDNDEANDDKLLADEDELLGGAQSDNDEYDEFAGTVQRSQGAEPDQLLDHDTYAGTVENLEEDAGDKVHDLAAKADLDATIAAAVSALAPDADAPRATTSTQRSAIADSQPPPTNSQQFDPPPRPEEPSSMPAFVPGSQYVMSASDSQPAVARPRVLDTSSIPKPPPATSQMQHSKSQSGMPSSPPLLSRQVTATERASSPLPESMIFAGTEDASHARRKLLAQFQVAANRPNSQTKSQHEIPESDDLEVMERNSRQQTAPPTFAQTESNNLLPFSTAQTHLSATGPSSAKPPPSPILRFTRGISNLSNESPRRAAGVLRFGEIAADPTPPQGSGEDSLDFDGIMGDVMTAEDEDFINAVSNPRPDVMRKRVKIASSRMSKTSPRETSAVSPKKSAALSSIRKLRFDPTEDGSSGDEQKPLAKRAKLTVDTTAEIAAAPTQQALRNSPSKANELRVTTPEKGGAPSSTPDSVRKREQAGAKATSQLLAARLGRSKTGRSTLSTNQAAHLERTVIPAETKSSRTIKKSAKKTMWRPTSHPLTTATPLLAFDGSHDAVEPNAFSDEASMSHAERVFALFKGTPAAYYPAACISSSAYGNEYRVRFDDGATTTLEHHQICSLDLRVGDQVKVDIPGMRSKTYIVKALKSSGSTLTLEYPQFDVHGHDEAEVQAKPGRDSLSGNGVLAQGEGENTTVALTSLYIVPSLWKQFEQRKYSSGGAGPGPDSGVLTPYAGAQMRDGLTPANRSRRSIVPTAKLAALQNPSRLREGSVASSTSFSSLGIFAGMAFAISYGSNEAEKANITRLIQRNGGLILEDGFEELFALPPVSDALTSPPSKPSNIDNDVTDNGSAGSLRLKLEYADLGFVALLADRHSRRAKYMQALALGLPTLSGKWITDSLDAAKNSSFVSTSQEPINWSKYLLPAGESAYLGGAVRSRTLKAYDGASPKFRDHFECREKLLDGEGVLIVVGKKGKSTWERRKAYAFLTLALGAGQVKRVADLDEANATLSTEPEAWKWVYVDDSISGAETALFGASKVASGGKKRKRGEPSHAAGGKMSGGNGDVTVVGDEFVVQSLILGALID